MWAKIKTFRNYSLEISKVPNSVLLDTNALLWLLDPSSGKLGKKAIQTINDSLAVYASATSIFEIQIKSMIGKLKAPDNLLDAIRKSNLTFLEITSEHAYSIDQFPLLKNHDPFDRLLLSQALVDSLEFITADQHLLGLKDIGVKITDARV